MQRTMACLTLASWFLLVPIQVISKTTELQLTQVSVTPNAIAHSSKDPASVSFHLNQPATVTLEIFDANNLRVYHTSTPIPLVGDHELQWKAVNDAGAPVAPGAYYYVLQAHSSDGSQVRYDLTDITGGKIQKVEPVTYIADEGVVKYTVSATSRLFVRYGIQEHVLLGTLVNGKVHVPGEYKMPWNGHDASGRIKLAGHPKLDFFVHGMQLSRNAIVVKGTEPDYLAFDPTEQVISRTARVKPTGLNVHAYHKHHLCRDFSITLALIDKTSKHKKVSVVQGRTRFRVDIAPKDQAVVQNQRFEIQFYLDNQMLYENEVSYTPYNWTMDMSRVPPGVHHLTAIVVGYGAHFGVSTLEFKIDEKNKS